MTASERRPDGGPETTVRPYYVTWMHAAGVVLGLVALIVGGIDNPSIGFPVAICVLVALDVPASPKPADPALLAIVHGSVRRGGLKRGAFVKAMFAVALLYAGVVEFLAVGTVDSTFRVLLGTALAISSTASELEARAVRDELSVVRGNERA